MIASSERMQTWNAVGVSFQVKELSTDGKMKYAALVNNRLARVGAGGGGVCT
jgi:hypothetical protein